jgi:hypothetical protein
MDWVILMKKIIYEELGLLLRIAECAGSLNNLLFVPVRRNVNSAVECPVVPGFLHFKRSSVN